MDEISREKIISKTVPQWLKYIDSFPSPKNDIERTRYHFLCIEQFEDKKKRVAKNGLSLLLIPVCIVGSGFTSLLSRHTTKSRNCNLVEFEVENRKKLSPMTIGLPTELSNEYMTIDTYRQRKGKALFFKGCLDKRVFGFWGKYVKKYPYAFYMNLQILSHLMSIEKIIHLYNPKAIVTTESENDCCTSAITCFCENDGIEYIGLMHGEYLLSPLHAFVRFSRFYVWDELYINQFVRAHCNKQFFRIYKPDRFDMNIKDINENKKYFLTYYLQNQSEKSLMCIRDVLCKIVKRGKACCVRLHPRFSNRDEIEWIFDATKIHIEDSSSSDIKKSLSNTEYVAAMSSTVLSEAYENGIKAVIDDVSDSEYYEYLKRTMYINLIRIQERLSDILEHVLSE